MSRKYRELTFSEGQRIERRIVPWMKECQRWVDVFEEHAGGFKNEWLEMTDGRPSSDALVYDAIYFVVAARCVYLHCQSLLEAKLKSRDRATGEMRKIREKSPVIEDLYDRGNWVNHGAIDKDENYGMVFGMYKELDKTFEEMVAEATIKGDSVLRPVIYFSWADKEGQPVSNISEWQKNVIVELSHVVEYVKGVAW